MQYRTPLNRFPLVLASIVALAIVAPVVSADESGSKPSLPATLRYVSPLASYSRYVEQPVGSWREANDQVGRVGGWRAYASEAQKEPPAEGSAKKADPHAGHHPEPSK